VTGAPLSCLNSPRFLLVPRRAKVFSAPLHVEHNVLPLRNGVAFVSLLFSFFLGCDSFGWILPSLALGTTAPPLQIGSRADPRVLPRLQQFLPYNFIPLFSIQRRLIGDNTCSFLPPPAPPFFLPQAQKKLRFTAWWSLSVPFFLTNSLLLTLAHEYFPIYSAASSPPPCLDLPFIFPRSPSAIVGRAPTPTGGSPRALDPPFS